MHTGGGASVFDRVKPDDLILAFFPCTRFECQIQLAFRGKAFQMKKWTNVQKLEYAMRLHEELHHNYMLISKMVAVAENKGLRMVIENPYTQPHYLTTYWCIDPTIIDKDRTQNGDYMKKPTQFFFIGFKPYQNLVFEPLETVDTRNCERMADSKEAGKDGQTMRSEIHPQYASRFIRQFLIEGRD